MISLSGKNLFEPGEKERHTGILHPRTIFFFERIHIQDLGLTGPGADERYHQAVKAINEHFNFPA